MLKIYFSILYVLISMLSFSQDIAGNWEGALQIQGTEMPGLNHLFQYCKTCTVDEYADLEETFDPQTLKIIADWIKTERFK